MGQSKRKVVPEASRHLVCCNCRSCRLRALDVVRHGLRLEGRSFAFTCKGCTEVTVLVKEVEGLKQMVEGMY